MFKQMPIIYNYKKIMKEVRKGYKELKMFLFKKKKCLKRKKQAESGARMRV